MNKDQAIAEVIRTNDHNIASIREALIANLEKTPGLEVVMKTACMMLTNAGLNNHNITGTTQVYGACLMILNFLDPDESDAEIANDNTAYIQERLTNMVGIMGHDNMIGALGMLSNHQVDDDKTLFLQYTRVYGISKACNFVAASRATEQLEMVTLGDKPQPMHGSCTFRKVAPKYEEVDQGHRVRMVYPGTGDVENLIVNATFRGTFDELADKHLSYYHGVRAGATRDEVKAKLADAYGDLDGEWIAIYCCNEKEN
jgi:hypothetical protein